MVSKIPVRGFILKPFTYMIPGSKGLNLHELAQMWVNVLETRQNMSLKVGRKHHDMRIFCRINPLWTSNDESLPSEEFSNDIVNNITKKDIPIR